MWNVKFVSPYDERLLDKDEYHMGITDYLENTIYLANNLKVGSLKHTFLHELVHAFIFSYGFLQVNFTDEIVADFISQYLEEIYHDWELIKRSVEI